MHDDRRIAIDAIERRQETPEQLRLGMRQNNKADLSTHMATNPPPTEVGNVSSYINRVLRAHVEAVRPSGKKPKGKT